MAGVSWSNVQYFSGSTMTADVVLSPEYCATTTGKGSGFHDRPVCLLNLLRAGCTSSCCSGVASSVNGGYANHPYAADVKH